MISYRLKTEAISLTKVVIQSRCVNDSILQLTKLKCLEKLFLSAFQPGNTTASLFAKLSYKSTYCHDVNLIVANAFKLSTDEVYCSLCTDYCVSRYFAQICRLFKLGTSCLCPVLMIHVEAFVEGIIQLSDHKGALQSLVNGHDSEHTKVKTKL